MKITDIVKVLDAQVVVGREDMDYSINHGFASDLMSDVLTLEEEHLILITGLCNNQTIRTAEMANISVILFVRNKQVSQDMIELALENDIIIISCKYSMFKTVGVLYENGLEPVY
ncbi:MAG: DRTGG domain-containing protein [Bacteroidales bacterium]|jgi:predicted transcriptional regulator|uniref:DRTGG domain-containing protein n=1 Tax=bioreactor metagenome TaxID=1076179 RepID=A0A644VTX2_9ZZZZ|nr:DRTGG domain-containing protein [Bacteroidales bacterium]MEA4967263.1 DRTGG domain-containing protein [Bacteroidaceae bacterium]NCC17440.1 hypothetical protein [Bacteroidia bacterium]MDD2576099.1 DRTGG domain-containing protein [Bacteroidales bacterium]MDD4739242.1 DRTGG domain-containing protein [Bacteroidales bacterium]